MRKIKITTRGWPWQVVQDWQSGFDKTAGEKYGWNPFSVKGFGRFGGGWAFKFGIDASKYDWVIYLVIGMIRIQFIEEKNK